VRQIISPSALTYRKGTNLPQNSWTYFGVSLSECHHLYFSFFNIVYHVYDRCSNKVAQDTAAQDREETKLQTYNQISSTLASITTTAASAVTPTLTNIIRNHMQSQLQVEASLKALEELWEEVFDVFVTEIARVIDDKLQDALQKVHAACDRTKTAVSPSSRKRKTVGVASRSISDSADDLGATRRLGILSRKSEEVAFQRELKRRRTESPFHDGSVQPSDKGGDINTQTNVKDVAQLPAKINQQAHSLDKENIVCS